MGNVRPPIASEFETEEQAASYDRWFRAEVEAALREADAPDFTAYVDLTLVGHRPTL
ncbi:Uncharacterised protein [Bordetella ansorpii]|uniref:Stability determinant domain-containing protein n=1 Tax=Bordetella ansorpii TaxID=288768 RepID=A0A157QNH0_9BORD|nr:hypothetical protein [Bordetella ansorpii]SAI47327.1 Uncharacterised protein [Bordetella ansorpii]